MARIIRAAGGSATIPMGFPLLVDDGIRIIEPAFEYLLELATLRGRPASPATVQSYAEHLLDWFDSLEQNDIDWKCATRTTLARYLSRHNSHPSPVTGRRYASATTRGRVGTVCRFYKWAASMDWIERTPFPTKGYRNFHAGSGFLGHTRRRGQRDERNPLVPTEKPGPRRGLYDAEVRKLLEALTEPYWTMAIWALSTGMRRMELCALTTRQVPDSMALRERDGRLLKIRLTVTKGRDARTAYAPLGLIDHTNRHYMQGPRREAARAAGRKKSRQLFLGPRGTPITPDRASKAFAKAFRRAGINGNLHALRHTYASIAHHVLTKHQDRNKPINVLMTLRDLMGHSSVGVTEIYLSTLELRPEKIEKALNYLYGEVMGDDPESYRGIDG